MLVGPSRNPAFTRLWAAYAVSALGTWLAFDALPLLAILVLHVGATAVSLLAAVGPAVGALVAIPLGPWVEFRRKRRVMVAMDLVRCGALLGLVIAFAIGRLALWQLLVVTVVVAASDNAFRAASGALLKELLTPDELLRANVWLESTTWTATGLGPPLGGAAVGLFGPIATVAADAASYLLSALGLRKLRVCTHPVRTNLSSGGVLEGWRHILSSPELRPLFLNTALVNGLIMATAPLMAVLMLGQLGFAPWQYGLVFGAPCAGGLLGSRLSRPLAARLGPRRALVMAGTARSCWSIGLVLVRPGVVGLLLVFVVQFGLVASVGAFNPLYATARLEHTPAGLLARTLSAWSIGSALTIAALTALGGLVADAVGPRPAILAAGLILLATPLLLRVNPAHSYRLNPGVRAPSAVQQRSWLPGWAWPAAMRSLSSRVGGSSGGGGLRRSS